VSVKDTLPLAVRRLVRLAGTGSPAAFVRAARREHELRRAEDELESGLRGDGPIVVGPFTGEVGYELLYWRPFVLRLLRTHRVEPGRVTVVGRGGSGAWYRPAAASFRDVFELVAPERVRDVASRREFGSPKQWEADELDREIVARLAPDGATVVHPRFMYWRSRFLWQGLRDPAEAGACGDYDDLPRSPLPAALEALLPDGYVAVKAYFNECIPETAESRDALAETVAAVVSESRVVLLSTPVAVDTHGDLADAAGAVAVGEALDPVHNLAQQAEIVARARALVSTYGGFSYLGPFLGVPTVALSGAVEDNPNHERVLREVRPAAPFARVPLEAAAVVEALQA